MAANLTVDVSGENAKDLKLLEKAIEDRVRYLGETASAATIATAINILSALRARTKVVDPKKASGFVTVAERADLQVGWMSEGGHRRRCVKVRGGSHVRGVRVVDLWSNVKYNKFESLRVFMVQDLRKDNGSEHSERFLVIAKDEMQARDYAAKRRETRIRRRAGMAKLAIGRAQSLVSNRPAASVAAAGSSARIIANRNALVRISSAGWNSGSARVDVTDALDFATSALRGGRADFSTALKKAANMTVGIINRKAGQIGRLSSKLTTPFPEVAGRK